MTVLKVKYRHNSVHKGWTPARRLAQSQRLRASRPWLRSTGPKTVSGKAKVSQNARKHGMRSVEMRCMARALSNQGRFLRLVNLDMKARARACRRGEDSYAPPFPPRLLQELGRRVTLDLILAGRGIAAIRFA